MAQAAPFIALLRRATHSGFDTVVMNNRMLIQCYDLAIDSDVALNYMLYVPDTDAYDDKIYDQAMILQPRGVLAAYSEAHKALEETRKAKGLKPKDISEEVMLVGENSELKFLFYLNDELFTTSTCKVQYPISNLDTIVANCESSYQKLIENIKAGGACLVFDGARMNLQKSIMEYPSIYYYVVKFRGKKVRIPFARSMFLGIKDVDTFYFSVQESNIQDIYVYSYQITKKDITEQFFGYVLAY